MVFPNRFQRNLPRRIAPVAKPKDPDECEIKIARNKVGKTTGIRFRGKCSKEKIDLAKEQAGLGGD